MAFYTLGGAEFDRDITQGSKTDLPKLSTKLDSIRPYQWEVEFTLPGVGNESQKLFTVAAKQITEIGYTVEDIEVHRVNDRYYYPGKATPEEVTMTFDNLKQDPAGGGQDMPLAKLYEWMANTYNPLTGAFGDVGSNQVKSNITIHQLDEDLTPLASVTLYGAWPKSFKTAEYNYATATDMHTITVSFRYDFMSAQQ